MADGARCFYCSAVHQRYRERERERKLCGTKVTHAKSKEEDRFTPEQLNTVDECDRTRAKTMTGHRSALSDNTVSMHAREMLSRRVNGHRRVSLISFSAYHATTSYSSPFLALPCIRNERARERESLARKNPLTISDGRFSAGSESPD